MISFCSSNQNSNSKICLRRTIQRCAWKCSWNMRTTNHSGEPQKQWWNDKNFQIKVKQTRNLKGNSQKSFSGNGSNPTAIDKLQRDNSRIKYIFWMIPSVFFADFPIKKESKTLPLTLEISFFLKRWCKNCSTAVTIYVFPSGYHSRCTIREEIEYTCIHHFYFQHMIVTFFFF